MIVAATLALSPVSQTAQGVLDRFETIGDHADDSTTERRATFSATFPQGVTAPLGHGLGSAGEATKLGGDPRLRAPDNGYLSLIYQVGPIGFLLVIAAIVLVMRAAWEGAMARAPGQDLRVLLFAMLALLLVQLTAGDEFYGSHGVIFWFLAGQVLAFDHACARAPPRRRPRGGRRRATSRSAAPRPGGCDRPSPRAAPVRPAARPARRPARGRRRAPRCDRRARR